jgi:hypothetical protein
MFAIFSLRVKEADMSQARLLRLVPVTGSALARPGALRASAVVPAAAQQKPKLRDQVRDAIRTGHMRMPQFH